MKICTLQHYAKSAVATALTIGLGLAGINASAATSVLDASLTFNNQGLATFSQNIAPGYSDFNAQFTFTTNASTGGATSISSFNGSYFSTGFTSFNLIDVTNGNTVVAAGSVGSSFVSQLGFSGLNSNTTYGLSLIGTVTNPDTGGFFVGTVAVNPVPEPSEYLLMLCGLALLGFLATKRKQEREFAAF
ncbi:MAG: FxDxF family PEP-CTERM protein [Gammaproteobacteria bacterium]|nr:FxDxF family PEP-CTERM protein [Gammaproteobacteria bacterium]MBU1481747.1 FxDxF family PEP-CTERM protein [Gammaproteobacteria bacterium]